jgi:hypothetical protein
MNYSKVLDELNSASPFELCRLEQAIRRSLEDPVRIRQVKDSLKVGQDIEYFDAGVAKATPEQILRDWRRSPMLYRNVRLRRTARPAGSAHPAPAGAPASYLLFCERRPSAR